MLAKLHVLICGTALELIVLRGLISKNLPIRYIQMLTVGSKAQVYHGTAKKTPGGLTKKDLMKTKRGRIVSRRKHAIGQKRIRTLRRLGYVAKKGTFKLFKKGKRGGAADLVEDMSGNEVATL